MKTYTFKSLLGSAALASALMLTPVAAFATSGTSTPSLRINGDGIVHVMKAEVTSVSGSIINAITRFKDTIVNWSFSTNATTTVAANNSLTASTTDIRVGDKINVSGALVSLGSTISVNATKIKDTTSMNAWKSESGTVQSVNTGNGTFVLLTRDNKQVTVQTNASTTFSLGKNVAGTLGSLTIASKVAVTGSANADGTLITASKVVTKDGLKDKHDWKGKWFGNHNKNKGHK